LAAHVAAAPDAELVRRFRQSRASDAFAELVARHAGLVWGVCRRTLPQDADAEDAFQATFLALARNIGGIDPSRPLGGWLHAVAVRVSRRALGRTLRRRIASLPSNCEDSPHVSGDVTACELYRAIDEEIARLPAALRGPVVLCCLEGRARDEAAAALGCSVLAVKSRLERARHLLRRALGRRGIPLPAALVVLGLGVGRVGAALQARAVSAALGVAPPAITRLAAAAVPSVVSYLLAAIAVTVIGVASVGLAQLTPTKDSPIAKANSPAAKEVPRRDRFGDPLPDGAVRRFGTLRFRHEAVAALAFTPDGKHLVAGVGSSPLAVFDATDGRRLRNVGETSANNHYGFALTPDGKHVFTTGYHLGMYELDTGRKMRSFEAAVRCSSVAVSPDGTKIAVAREHTRVAMIFEVATGKKLADLPMKDVPASTWGPFVHDLAFSPDGTVVAAVVFEAKELKPNQIQMLPVGIKTWDAATGNPLGTAGPADHPPVHFAFVPGTKQLAFPRKEGIQFWDLEASKELRRINLAKEDVPTTLTVSANGKTMAGYRPTGEVVVYDVATDKVLRRVKVGESIGPVAVALSPDGRTVACGKRYIDAAVRVWDVNTGQERLADAGHRGRATLSLSSDGQTLIGRSLGQVIHWNLATGEGAPKPDDQMDVDGFVPGSDINRRKYRTPRYQFTIDQDAGRIEVRTRDGSKLVAQAPIPKDYQRAHAFSADGQHLAVSFQDRGYSVLLWAPGERPEPFKLTGHPDACQKLMFTRDGKYLIAGAGTHNQYKSETIFVYETATGQLVRKLATNSAPGLMVMTADDRTLITGGLWNDATVRVWDLPTGKELAVLIDPAVTAPSVPEPRGGATSNIGGLALSADERFLAVLTGDREQSSVSLWDTGTWKLVKAFAPAGPRSDAASLAVGPAGRSVFAAYLDSTILEWDVAGRSGKRPVPTAARLDELWQELGDPSGSKGYTAAWELLDHPTVAVALLKSKLAPAVAPEPALVRELVGKLGSDSFREREEAGKKLIALGESVLPILREAAGGKRSAEVKERLDKVIASLSGVRTPDQVRERRAIAVLEWSGLPEADEYLRKLAAGAVEARRTIEAKGALGRRGLQ
jgi:RNA polymerase sigma factor (sigma-70 family)